MYACMNIATFTDLTDGHVGGSYRIVLHSVLGVLHYHAHTHTYLNTHLTPPALPI